MRLHTLKKSSGLQKKANRLGRGNASKGNYSGKGLKGQKARTGFSQKANFEGGQTPIAQRLPKLRGFKRYYKLVDHFDVINISRLEKDENIKDGDMTKQLLKELGYIKKQTNLVKILGNGELTKKLTFKDMDAFSASAIEKIEKAGGKINKTAEVEKKVKKGSKEETKEEVKEETKKETKKEVKEEKKAVKKAPAKKETKKNDEKETTK